MQIRVLTSIALLLVAVNGCVNGASAAEDKLRDTHTIAIISALGNDVEMRTYGITRFGDGNYTLHTNWSIDSDVVREATLTLNKRFAVRQLSISPGLFADLAPGSEVWSDVERRVKSLPHIEGIDAYLVVFPARVSTSMGLRWHGMSVSRGLGLGEGTTSVEIYYSVGVFSAATGARIVTDAAVFPPLGDFRDRMPKEYCANSLWAEDVGKMNPEQMARLHQEMASLVSRSIAFTLADMKLISEADASAITTTFAVEGDPTCRVRVP